MKVMIVARYLPACNRKGSEGGGQHTTSGEHPCHEGRTLMSWMPTRDSRQRCRHCRRRASGGRMEMTTTTQLS